MSQCGRLYNDRNHDGSEPGASRPGGPLLGQTEINFRPDRLLADVNDSCLVRCDKDCGQCWRQCLQGPYTQRIARKVTDEEAKTRIGNLLDFIAQDRSYLVQYKKQHGTTIINRLLKRKKGSLGEILRKFDPRLTEGIWWQRDKHAELLRGKDLNKRLISEDVATPWLCSYAYGNHLVEQPLKVIALINSRISHPPEDWITFDFDQTHHMSLQKLLRAKLNSVCVVIRHEGFGRIVRWDADKVHIGDIMAFPMCEIVLKLQARILALLVHIVSELMNGSTSNSGNGCAKWDKFVQVDFRRDIQPNYWSEFSARPFSSPLSFDIDRLVELAKGHLEESTDTLWGMQTDFAYFQWTIRSYLAARYSGGDGLDNKYITVIKDVLDGFMTTAMCWKWVLEECLNMQQLVQKYKDCVQPPCRISEYKKGLQSLAAVAELMKQFFQLVHGPELFLRMPELQDRLKIQPVEKDGKIWTQTEVEITPREDCLVWVVKLAINTEPQIAPVDLSWIFANLDDMLYVPKQFKSPTLNSKRTNEHIMRFLSGLAAVVDMLRTVRCALPDSLRPNLEILEQENQGRHYWRSGRKQPDSRAVFNFRPLIDTMEKVEKFSLPKGQVTHEYIKRWLEADTLSRNFWKQERIRWSLYLSHHSVEDRQSWIDLYSYDLQQEHISARGKELEKLQQSLKSKLGSRVHATTKDDKLQDWQKSDNDKTDRPEIMPVREKRKVKTHGTALDDVKGSENQQNQPGLDLAPEVKADYVVKRNSFKIFMSMFPASPEECSAVRWEDFLCALADAGFSIRARGGSAYSFTLNKDGIGGSINEHRPHPSDELSPVRMRFIGRRLQKHFGIDRGSFKCKH